MLITSVQHSFPTFHDFTHRIQYIKDLLYDILLEYEKQESRALHFILLPEYSLGWKVKPLEEESINNALMELKDLSAEFTRSVIIPGTGGFKTSHGTFNMGFIYHRGKVIGDFSKQYPFGNEPKRGISKGFPPRVFQVGDARFTSIVCADLWYPELLREQQFRDVDFVFIPVQSVVNKPNLTDYGYLLWKSLMITRSKENVQLMVSADWNKGRILEGQEYYAVGASFIIDPSFKYENEVSDIHPGITVASKPNHVLHYEVSIRAIHEYKEYRRKMGLLPVSSRSSTSLES